jgi:molybdate transport system regulatory protein
MKASVKFFVAKDGQYVLGPGKIQLLRLVEESGSLRRAARAMGMSYRWAWGRIRKAEEAIGVPMLQQGEDSASRAKTLSRDAREIIEWFARTEAELAEVLRRAEATRPRALKDADSGENGT